MDEEEEDIEVRMDLKTEQVAKTDVLSACDE